MYRINTSSESLIARRNRTYLHLRSAAGNSFRFPMLRGMGVPVSIHDAIGSGGSWTAAWVPYGSTLQVHFFPVAKRVAAFRTAGASRMEMMVIAGLQNLAADVTVAIGAFYSKLLLIILLAVRHAVSVEKNLTATARASFESYLLYPFLC